VGADYDGAWKELLEVYFRPFLEFCFPDAARRVDWIQPIGFLDKELQEVVRDAESGKLQADKLVEVHCLDGQEEWLLIHVEVQGQPDPKLPRRMYDYHHRICDRYLKPVVSMAVLADERVDWKPSVYEAEHWGCRLRFEYLVCKLIEIPPRRLEQEDNPAAVVIAAYLATLKTADDMVRRKQLKWQLTRRLFERGYQRKDILEVFRLVDWLMVLPESLTVAFRRELIQYEQEKAMPHLTSIEELDLKEIRQEGLEKGLEKGRLEGRQEGRQEGRYQTICRLLDRRWGKLSAALDEQLRGLSSEQLDLLAEALLDFQSLADLEAWLRNR
jgi:predicted transposase YdaD